MDKEIYVTSTNSSFLQALGPHRIQATSEPSVHAYHTSVEKVTYTVKIGEITNYGLTQKTPQKKKELLDESGNPTPFAPDGAVAPR